MALSKSTEVTSEQHGEEFNEQLSVDQAINVQTSDQSNNTSQDEVIQVLNMQLMDISKMKKYIESVKEISHSIENFDISQKFIEVYNHNQKKLAKENYFRYQLSNCRKNKDIEDIDYAVAYCCRKIYLSRVEKSETSDPEETKLSEFIIFFVLKNENKEITNIFAATTGGAWNVVRSYINRTFPITIIEQVGSANKIKSIERRSVFENDTRKEVLYQLRHADLYQTSSLYYLVINITCEIDEKNGKELLNLLNKTSSDPRRKSLDSNSDQQSDYSESDEPLDKRTKTNKKTTKQSKVEIHDIKITTAGSLTILKELKTEDYFDILKLFERYLHSKEPIDSNFDFLHFFTTENESELDDALLEDMFNRYRSDSRKEQNVALRHKYFEDFFLSKKFEIKIPPRNRFEDIGSEAPSINTIMEKMEASNIDLDTFKKRMKTGKLRFSNKKDTTASIINCIEGEIFFKEQHYFKIRSMWYRLRVDYLSLLQQDFEKAMDELFIEKGKEGSLPLHWIKNNPLNQDELQRHLSYNDAEMNDLMKKLRSETVSYISQGKVMQEKLVGEILQTHTIKKYKNEIEDALSHCSTFTTFEKDYWDEVLDKRITSRKNEKLNRISDKDLNQPIQKKKRGRPKKKVIETPLKDLDTIWRELNRKRYVLTGKRENTTFIKNPFPYPLEKEKNYVEIQKFLTDAYKPDQREDDYNTSYLNIDTADKGPKYLVFDTICPDGIESCDILRYADITMRYSIESLYLYHVKEEFGQNTRDVCSQILNSAIRIQEALRTNQEDHYLKRLWDLANNLPEEDSINYEWRKKLKAELEAIGEENFIDMFRYKDIVFVYAYLTPTGFKKSYNREELSKTMSDACKELQFINKYGFLTSKFFYTTQQKFVDILKKKVSQIDDAACKAAFDILSDRRFSGSTLGKMEVIQLAEKLKTFQNRFKFKICDIPISYLN